MTSALPQAVYASTPKRDFDQAREQMAFDMTKIKKAGSNEEMIIICMGGLIAGFLAFAMGAAKDSAIADTANSYLKEVDELKVPVGNSPAEIKMRREIENAREAAAEIRRLEKNMPELYANSNKLEMENELMAWQRELKKIKREIENCQWEIDAAAKAEKLAANQGAVKAEKEAAVKSALKSSEKAATKSAATKSAVKSAAKGASKALPLILIGGAVLAAQSAYAERVQMAQRLRDNPSLAINLSDEDADIIRSAGDTDPVKKVYFEIADAIHSFAQLAPEQQKALVEKARDGHNMRVVRNIPSSAAY